MKINSLGWLDTKWLFSFAILCSVAMGLVLFDGFQYQITSLSIVLATFLAVFASLLGIVGNKQWRETLNEPVLWAFVGYVMLTFLTSVYIIQNESLGEYFPHFLGHLLMIFGAVWLFVNLQSNRWFLDNFTQVIFWGVWVYLALLMITIYNNLYYVAVLDKFFFNPRNGVYSFIKLVPILLASRLWLQRDNPNYKPHKDWLVYLVIAVIFLCAARLLRKFGFIPSDITWFFSNYVLAGYGLLFGYRFMRIGSTKPFYKDPWLWIILGFFLLQLGLMNLEHRVFANSYEEIITRNKQWWRRSEAIIFPLVFGFLAMAVYSVRLVLGKRFGKTLPWLGILAAFLGVYIFYLGLGDNISAFWKAEYQLLGGGNAREVRAKCSLFAAFSDIFYIKPYLNLDNPCDRFSFGYFSPIINYHSYLTEVLHRSGLPGILLLGLGFILPFVYWLNRAEQKGAWVALLAIAIYFSFSIVLAEEDKTDEQADFILFYGLTIYPMVITLAIINAVNKPPSANPNTPY